MKYPKNDLWSVRQIEFLHDALEGYENKKAIYYPNRKVRLKIPDIETYEYTGILYFPNQDRTIIFEQGSGYGIKEKEIVELLRLKKINFEVK